MDRSLNFLEGYQPTDGEDQNSAAKSSIRSHRITISHQGALCRSITAGNEKILHQSTTIRRENHLEVSSDKETTY
jgi:hypothetical protein